MDDDAGQSGLALVGKRCLDVTGAIVGLVILSPVLALTAGLTYLESGRPVLYCAERIGRGGVSFPVFKFRSMRPDADSALHEDRVRKSMLGLATDGAETHKIVDDPRITRVGRFIRRTSIDELPQLLNVLRGEMSLVGPRPEVPYAVPLYEEWQLRRFSVLPGMTGLWQVSGRSQLSQLDMLRLDVEYADTWSLRADVRILLQTVKPLLGRIGAG